MIEHLSADQISQWLTGERPPQLERHVDECHQCRTELEQIEGALVQFRAAVHASQAPPPLWQEPAPHGFWHSWPRLALASATLALLVAAPFYWHSRADRRAAEEARADALLLEQVDSSISRAVPEPMEPLVNLVTWNASPVENRKKAEQQ